MKPELQPLSGFGRREITGGYVVRPRTVEELADALGSAREATLRGAGRSYGDAATNREGIVLDLGAMDALRLDPEEATVEVGPGATIAGVCRAALPHGLWPPVVTGTSRPTIGGAIAMNVHGKNAFRAGPLGEHVAEMDLLTPRGDLLTLLPDDPRFRLVLGSAGTLGVVTRAVLRLRRIPGPGVRVRSRRVRGWDEALAAFDAPGAAAARGEEPSEFRVASIDPFASGGAAGRGFYEEAWHDEGGATPEPDARRRSPHLWRALRLATNPPAMRALNAARARLAPVGARAISLERFSFQLDAIPDWERAYGSGGFVQYQPFVPEARAREVFAGMGRILRAAGVPAYLAVLKRHRADGFPLSPGLDGFSLALDIPAGGDWLRVRDACWRMNDLVLEAGGRFYLAKDSTLRPEDVRAYLGEALTALRTLKAEWDPEGVLTSDLARRLALFE